MLYFFTILEAHMDDISKGVRKTIWDALRKNHTNDKTDFESIIRIIKKSYPEIPYSECCTYIQSLFRVHDEQIPFSPDAFKWICKALVSELKPSSVLVPFSDGSESDYLGKDLDVDYHFVNEKLKAMAIEYCSINSIVEIELNVK